MELDKHYFDAKVEPIKQVLSGMVSMGKRVCVSSSFQTHSIPLLHIVKGIDNKIPVVMTNTGFLFPETLQFAKTVVRSLGLELVEVRSEIPKSMQMSASSHLYYADDPDYCCSLNKVKPLNEFLVDFDCWVNGVRRDQSETRKSFEFFERTPAKYVRYHPMLDWTAKEIFYYSKVHGLPAHPLDERGYVSIGCEPCTARMGASSDSRSSRWEGLKKSECGLHTELIAKV